MDLQLLPFNAPLERYAEQADTLLQQFQQRNVAALACIRRHPRFLDDKIPWLPKSLSDEEVFGSALDRADAQLAVARCYDFQSWAALEEYTGAVGRADSPAARFENAVDAVITGDEGRLRGLLSADAELVRARSTRVNCFDPPVHRATLLHYVAANGVEGFRQKTPRNAVEMARILLDAGAEVDALADMYGVPCTTMSMLVSSAPPAEAGVQVALTELLLDRGAAIEGSGSRKWGTPLMTALIFGFPDVAEALARRGARVDSLPAAAGLGRVEDARRLLSGADGESRHGALALAAQLGRSEVVRLLLQAGVDANRYNPEGHHAHATPLHQAVIEGHEAVVRLFVESGARLDLRDKIYQATPLGWAIHGRQAEIEKYLRGRGAE